MTRTRRRRPRVPPVDPQLAVNRLWEQWLARRYPGTRWEIVRVEPDDANHDGAGEGGGLEAAS